MEIKEIVFDFDNTLLKSRHIWIYIHGKICKELGFRPLTNRRLRFYGNSFEETLKNYYPDADVEIVKRTYDLFKDDVKAKPIKGMNSAIKKLSKHYPLHILTSRSKEMFYIRAEQAGLELSPFEIIIVNEDNHFQKPDPRAFDKLKKLVYEKRKTQPNQILYVGDEINDMKAALGAGLEFVAVLSGFATKEKFIKEGLSKDKILKNATCLPGYLGLR